MSYIVSHRPVRCAPWPFFLALILLLGAACWVSFQHNPPVCPGQLEMKKSPGKNEPHTNQKARERAEQEFQKAFGRVQKAGFETPKVEGGQRITQKTSEKSRTLAKEKRLERRKPFSKAQRQLK